MFITNNVEVQRNLMRVKFLQLYASFQNLVFNQEGQDLVEYALLLTMISLALISSVSGIASAVSSVFTNISSTLAAA